jgi:PAS domain-containing protein/anti-sigma regulatory factor (Ser/Thr protein kinase)
MVSQLFTVGVVWGSVLVVAASTVLAWRQRPRPGATAFAVAMLAATWWVATSSLGLFALDPAVRVFWATAEWAGIVTFPVAWLVFALAYTGRSEWTSARRIGSLSVVPAVTFALALTDGVFHDLVYRSVDFAAFGTVSILYRTFGPWFWVHAAYSTALLVVGGALVVQLATERRLLYRGQATALVLVVAAPLVGSAVYVGGASPVEGFDPTPYTFVISGAAGLAALTQFSFLDAVPVTNRVARRSVVENVDAGVLVADTTGHVVDANPRAGALFDTDDPEGAHVSTLLPESVRPERAEDGTGREGDGPGGTDPGADGHDGVPESCDRESADHAVAEDVVAHERGDGVRYYEVSGTTLTDESGALTGRIYLVRDVTDRRTRLQRLNVLNRVLRHNLRNEMNVIYGFADTLEYGDPDPEVVASDIRGKAEELVALSGRAREIDELLTEDDGPPTDLCRVVAIECGRVDDDYPGVAVDTETPGETLHVDASAGTVVANLVENAARHNTADEPRMTVTVTAADGEATVRVADNGPGIPEQERSAVDADLETQLGHGSGLGLWLVNWGTTNAGGDLTIEDRDGGGTVVTATFQLVDAGEGPGASGRDGPEADGTDASDEAGTTASDGAESTVAGDDGTGSTGAGGDGTAGDDAVTTDGGS